MDNKSKNIALAGDNILALQTLVSRALANVVNAGSGESGKQLTLWDDAVNDAYIFRLAKLSSAQLTLTRAVAALEDAEQDGNRINRYKVVHEIVHINDRDPNNPHL